MPLLVSSASGVNGDGYGALLAFDLDGRRLGKFSDDARIEDPRGLAVDQKSGLLFLNSGSDRVLALNRQGEVVRETGRVAHLKPGGANFGPDGRYYLTLRGAGTILALPPILAGVYARLGDEPHAMSYLERAYEKHRSAILFIRTVPELDSIRSSPRFRDLVRHIGFPQPSSDKN